MNDLAYYASDIFEGLVNLIGVFFFFIFVLPPFLIIFIPLLIFSSSIIFCGIGIYLTYVICGVGWELLKNSIAWASSRKNARRLKVPRRPLSYERQEMIPITDLVEYKRERRLSGALTPRRIAQPRSRSGSMHLKKSDSLRSLVGPSSDHDFEDTGGWANSREDDEAVYMARTIGVQDLVHSPVLYHNPESSFAVHGGSTGARTPGITSRPVSRGEPWKFTAGGTGATTPRAQRSGTVTPDSYFSLSTSQSKGVLNLDQLNPALASSVAAHRKASLVTPTTAGSLTDSKHSQRDSGFFG